MLSVGTFMQSQNKDNAEEFAKMDSYNKETIDENLKTTFLSRHLIDKNTAEVDLHIEELIEDNASLSNEQMLKVQMEYAIKCLNEAIIET